MDPELQALLAKAAKPTPGLGNEHQPGDAALMALLPKELQGTNTSLPPMPAQQPSAPTALPPTDPDANRKYGDELPATERARITANINKMAAQNAPDSDIEQYLSQVEGLSKRADVGASRSALGPMETAANGLTMGLAPYIGGAADATMDKIGDAVSGEDNGSWMDKYRQYRDLAKDLDTGFASQHPILHGLTKAAASIPPSVLLAEMVPSAWIGKGFVNKAVASGAGGVALQSEENAANAGGGPSARMNAVLHENPLAGFAGGVAGAAVAPMVRGVKNIFAPNVHDAAAEILGGVAGNDLGDDAANKMTNRAQEFLQAGKPARAFDLAGANTKQYASAAQAVPGQGKQDIIEALKARNAGEGDRVLSDLAHYSGASTENAYLTGERLMAEQQARAKPLYDAALAHPVSPDVVEHVAALRKAFPELDRVFANGQQLRAGDRALANGGVMPPAPAQSGLAEELRQNYGDDPKMLAFVAKQLGVDPSALAAPAASAAPAMDVGTIHYAKRALDDLLDPIYYSGKSIPPQRAWQLQQAFGGLLAKLEAENPAYRLARTTYKGDAEARDALALGGSIFDPANIRSPEAIQAEVASMPTNQQALFKQGAYDALRRTGQNVDDTRSIATRLFGNDAKRSAVSSMFESDDAYRKFLNSVGLDRTLRENATDVIQGSRTIPLGKAVEDLTGRTGAGDLLSGVLSPRRVGRSLVRKQGNMVSRDNTYGIVNELARMMNTEVGTPEFGAVMRALRRLPEQAAQRDAVNLGTAAAAGGLTAQNAPR